MRCTPKGSGASDSVLNLINSFEVVSNESGARHQRLRRAFSVGLKESHLPLAVGPGDLRDNSVHHLEGLL
ncbi:hypothetical protein KOR34_44680 [Posidoniimonas corsicana]|uniref:Uncharacterized protein n=1 Tax=Posidoniimonas corsicana TaxID=1938618 RepID=A0A5C5UXM4_9BACT|nr:hypothetical protein KOR34_44680 [Posidoniimonas corsicana]